jgi:hypothetical protein
VAVQVAEFPDGGIGPPAAVILFGFAFQFQEMGTQIVTVGQIPHDVEEPIAHPAWEIGHLIRRALLPTSTPKKDQSILNLIGKIGRLDETYRDIPAGTKVLDVGVIVFGIDASGRS